MKRFPITSIIKYLFIILIIGFFIILLLPEEKKTSKIEEKPESTVVEKNIKNKSPCAAKPPGGHLFVKLIKFPSYLKNQEKCRRLSKSLKSKLLDKKSVVRPEKKLEHKIKKTTEILTPKKESGD